MSRDEIMKAILAGFVVVSLIVAAIVIGSRKATPPKLTAPSPVAPVPEPPAPMPPVPTPPTPPQPPERVFSPSFIRGYHDGYSGAWLAPARWMVVSEYRAGHHAGRQDRLDGKPNRFNQKR